MEDFANDLKDNLNKIPALLVVTQRPRDLTRGQLKELVRPRLIAYGSPTEELALDTKHWHTVKGNYP